MNKELASAAAVERRKFRIIQSFPMTKTLRSVSQLIHLQIVRTHRHCYLRIYRRLSENPGRRDTTGWCLRRPHSRPRPPFPGRARAQLPSSGAFLLPARSQTLPPLASPFRAACAAPPPARPRTMTLTTTTSTLHAALRHLQWGQTDAAAAEVIWQRRPCWTRASSAVAAGEQPPWRPSALWRQESVGATGGAILSEGVAPCRGGAALGTRRRRGGSCCRRRDLVTRCH